jgi:hypothetical protein
MRQHKASAAAKKAKWLRSVQDAIVRIDAAHAGRIDWGALEYSYLVGRAPDAAASLYLEANPAPPARPFSGV